MSENRPKYISGFSAFLDFYKVGTEKSGVPMNTIRNIGVGSLNERGFSDDRCRLRSSDLPELPNNHFTTELGHEVYNKLSIKMINFVLYGSR